MNSLQPYFTIAETEAKKSPCARRQYGSVIVYPGLNVEHLSAYNERQSHCCDAVCVRDRYYFTHGGNVEAGAEIHSEAAVLLKRTKPQRKGFFVLVGFDTRTGEQLLAEDTYPCHVCAVLIKFGGFEFVYIRDRDRNIVPVSIAEIIEYREQVYQVY